MRGTYQQLVRRAVVGLADTTGSGRCHKSEKLLSVDQHAAGDGARGRCLKALRGTRSSTRAVRSGDGCLGGNAFPPHVPSVEVQLSPGGME